MQTGFQEGLLVVLQKQVSFAFTVFLLCVVVCSSDDSVSHRDIFEDSILCYQIFNGTGLNLRCDIHNKGLPVYMVFFCDFSLNSIECVRGGDSVFLNYSIKPVLSLRLNNTVFRDRHLLEIFGGDISCDKIVVSGAIKDGIYIKEDNNKKEGGEIFLRICEIESIRNTVQTAVKIPGIYELDPTKTSLYTHGYIDGNDRIIYFSLPGSYQVALWRKNRDIGVIYFIVLCFTFLIVMIISSYIRMRKRNIFLGYLDDIEYQIITLLIKNAGKMSQSDIVKEIPVSRSYIVKTINSLKERGIIAVEKPGNTNIVSLLIDI